MPRLKTKKAVALPTKLPKIVAFANQKGGAGKSTGAVHAADWFAKQGYSTVLVDADGQQSSSEWMNELKLNYEVISNPEALFDELPKLAKSHDVVIVDGPGNASEVTKAVLIRSDLVLIPCRDSMIDLASTGKIVQFVRQAKEIRGGLPVAAIYLNAVKDNTILLREAREALQDGLLPLLSTSLPDRQCIKDAPGQASTVFRMKGESPRIVSDVYSQLLIEALKLFEAES
ncbi:MULTISPECIES: ParA family protein [unclassified Leptolyngbya]|uniref:ParA family protein n=1 Tax=unclassified Leptolyngbya TaxID=2650499 RepID=UPI001689AF85|nr:MULTISPECIES: ParA family protein [unclassified Leptolyngbya]MBD1909863.1 ParA family protein [Leptolyngbya sp. FACHB-8]MBD2156959.1 ParA family protein [Leptolyngbya sp. FACHB-16]